MENARLAIFASGTGTNAKVLMDYFSNHESIHVECLISNKANCGAVDLAKKQQLDVGLFSNESLVEGNTLEAYLNEKEIDFLILAGFLRKIPFTVISSYKDRIINLHPSLLPDFGGKGMYGKYVHEAVLNAKKTQTGITIHLVNENYDEGNYIAQFYLPVLPNDTLSSLEERIRKLEHRYFPFVVEGYINSIKK
jgi:phosphoribosylglycinamide formyltransferase-1